MGSYAICCAASYAERDENLRHYGAVGHFEKESFARLRNSPRRASVPAAPTERATPVGSQQPLRGEFRCMEQERGEETEPEIQRLFFLCGKRIDRNIL